LDEGETLKPKLQDLKLDVPGFALLVLVGLAPVPPRCALEAVDHAVSETSDCGNYCNGDKALHPSHKRLRFVQILPVDVAKMFDRYEFFLMSPAVVQSQISSTS